MDSDIDADTPVRIKPPRKAMEADKKSPTLPSFPLNFSKSSKAISPVSMYSTKSSKEHLDVSEIRRILRKLRMELDLERNKNQELQINFQQLEEKNHKMEEKEKDLLNNLNSNWKRKLDDALRKVEITKNEEISKLHHKIKELSNQVLPRDNEIEYSKTLEIVTKMENLCSNSDHASKDWQDLNRYLDSIKFILNNPVLKDTLDSKLIKLKEHNKELTAVIKMLDLKLNDKNLEIETLHKKIEIQSQNCNSTILDDGDRKIKLDQTLHQANLEILQLQKQITWIKTSNSSDPVTRERVEVLSNIIQSFKQNQYNLELEIKSLQEKCNKFDNLHQKSLSTEQSSASEKSLTIEGFQFSDETIAMDRLLKYIRETNEKRTELEIEYAAMKTLLETKLQHKFLKLKDQSQYNNEENSEDSTDNLKIKLREMEKRRTQQALNYEEALLELEAMKKNNQRQNIDFYRRNGAKDDATNSTATSVMDGILGNIDFSKIDLKETSLFGRQDISSSMIENDMRYLLDLKNGSGSNIGLLKEEGDVMLHNSELSLGHKSDKQRKHITAPVQIRIENHPNQPNSKVLRWKSPDINNEGCEITSYHLYMDGDFYKAVGANDSLSLLLPNMDFKIHRISIRSVCPHGQSKDPQCTIEINSNTPTPSLLKANKITGTSAHISWMPSNSTLRHAVWVNGVKFCDCLPGIYKILLKGLTADALQKVRVHPVLDQYPDTTTISAYLDFQTLPASNETKINDSKKQLGYICEEIEPPKDVKLKLANRPGKFLVRWTCSQELASLSIKLVGYSILLNNQCVALVNGAKNDRFTLNLIDLRGISLPVNQKLLNVNEQSHLPLTVRTLGSIMETDMSDGTVQSKDSQPPLKFSGQVAARIAGTAAEAALMLGDKLALFLNLIEGNTDSGYDGRGFGKNSRSPKNSTKDHSQAKMSVPKIQITKDSSFSEDDENLSITQPKNKCRPVIDSYKEKFNQRVVSNQYSDYSNKPNPTIEDQSFAKQTKPFPNSPTERVPINSRANNYNNAVSNNAPPPERYYYGNQPVNDQIRYFVAIYEYDPGTMSPNPDAVNEELPFKTGQTIKVFGQVDEDGFYTGETNGRRGLVPSNMVKEVDNPNYKTKAKPVDNMNGQFIDRNQKRIKEAPVIRNMQAKPNVGQYPVEMHQEYAHNQYAGNQGSFDQYQIAHRKSTDSGVSYAASDPNSYQKHQILNNVPRQSSTASNNGSLNGKKMIALYDYDPQVLSPNVDSDAELAFKANDIIMIVSEIDEDGFYIGERNGQRGLVPSNFLTEAVPISNRLRSQQSFDGVQIQNQYKERNFSTSSNLSDPPPLRDNRFRNKTFENEREDLRNNHVNNNDYLGDRCIDIEHQKNVPNISYEDSFNSVPSINRSYVPKPEPKRIPYHPNLERRGSFNNEPNINPNENPYPRAEPHNNQIPQRVVKPLDDRRVNHDKPIHPTQSSTKLPLRRQSPPPPLEQDEMPIVMDLGPSKENQKKKKLSAAPDNYRANLSETHENYGNSDGLYANSNSSMSDNLERKRSVFKNPFKKKKS